MIQLLLAYYWIDTPIVSQYANKGIIFGGDAPTITTDSFPTQPVLSGSPKFLGAIEGRFVNPGDGVTPAGVVQFEFDAGWFDSIGSTKLSWFDDLGNLLGEQTNPETGYLRFSVTAPKGKAIYSWRIELINGGYYSPDEDGFAIDNVCFPSGSYAILDTTDYTTQPTPSPTPSPSGKESSGGAVVIQLLPLQDEAEAALRTSLGTAIGRQSCLGLGIPLTKAALLDFGRKIQPGATDTSINNAFEAFTLESLQLQRFPAPPVGQPSPFQSPEKVAKTGSGGTVPEAVGAATVITYLLGNPLLPIPIPYLNSSFWDAKAYREGSYITMTTGKSQTLGYLDYLSHYSPAGAAINRPAKQRPTPNLVYLTTSDVGISKSVLNYVGSTPPPIPFTPVAVWQAVACQVTPGQNKFRMGYHILLNRSRVSKFAPVFPSGGKAPGKIAPLRIPLPTP